MFTNFGFQLLASLRIFIQLCHLSEIGSSGAFLAAADWQALGWKLWKKNARVIARVGRAIHLLHRVLGVDFGD
ncbi:Gliotoxin thiomethyltransferase GtmA [Trichinella pseudospiralis]